MTSKYLVTFSTATTKFDENSTNTDRDWADGPVTRDTFVELVSEWSDCIREFAWIDALTAEAETLEGYDVFDEATCTFIDESWVWCQFELTPVCERGDESPDSPERISRVMDC